MSVVSPVSFFWGGAITDHLGAFAQVTYNAPPPGGFGGDPFGHTWTWDNTDIRYADSTSDRQLQCHLRHHRQQQSDRSGSMEHDAGMGLPLRRIDHGTDPRKPARSSTVPLRRMSAASAPTRTSTTCFISKRSAYHTLDFNAQNALRHRSIRRARAVRCRARIGARPSSRTGATIGSRSERSA